MRVFAPKAVATNTPADKHQVGVRRSLPVPDAPISVMRGDGALLQRKPNCACGGDCLGCAPVTDPEMIQTKLQVSTPGDQYEQEADRVAGQIMRVPEAPGPSASVAERSESQSPQRATGDAEHQSTPDNQAAPGPIERSRHSSQPVSKTQSYVQLARAEGEPLPQKWRTFFEAGFGHDFSSVRIHTDAEAAESARAVGALAFTFGSHIAFDSGQYSPDSLGGRFLLAHELAHTIQSAPSAQESGGSRITSHDEPAEREASQSARSVAAGGRSSPLRTQTNKAAIQRFEASERSQIGSFESLISATHTIANTHVIPSRGGPLLDWDGFVIATGGHTSTGGSSRSGAGLVQPRYVFTCRCGLLDMRHFFQLAYIAHVLWNRRATAMGRSHELDSEATSRFAAEDTPSNAMGAFFGANEAASSPGGFINELNNYLRICGPVDFTSLTPSDQTTIVNYYSARDAAGVPANQNESATPATLAVAACGASPDRSFPFVLDASDPNQKTITSLAAPYSFTGDTEIRDWVFAQSNTTLGNLPGFEKIRLINRLIDGWVSDEDIGAIERICASSSASQLSEIRTAIAPREREFYNDDQRARLHRTLNRSP